MSPYLSAALNPQLEEARRQAMISRLGTMGQLTKAGAYGGGRQAVMEGLLDENLQRNLAGITGTGYQKAFEAAQQQFNAEQNRSMQAAQQAGDYGLRALAAQQAGGETQRNIEQQGITADYNEFLAQRDYPMKQIQFLQSMLQGLPISTVAYQPASQKIGRAHV